MHSAFEAKRGSYKDEIGALFEYKSATAGNGQQKDIQMIRSIDNVDVTLMTYPDVTKLYTFFDKMKCILP